MSTEKKMPEVVTIHLTNGELLALKSGLEGFLNWPEPINTDALWHAGDILERISGAVRPIERTDTKIMESHANKDPKGHAIQQADGQGRTGYLIPKAARALVEKEIEEYHKKKGPEGIIFPASWRIPSEAIPAMFIGPWLTGLTPVIVRKRPEGEEGWEPEGETDGAEVDDPQEEEKAHATETT